MKFIKKFLKIIAVFLVVLALALWGISYKLAPVYKGETTLKNLSKKVEVYYDDNGVPHIEAENQEDAYKAFGYVHAQDRLWQMELMRRIAAGRLSEIFGEDLIDVDRFMGSLCIEDKAVEAITNLDKNSEMYKMTQAYLDGVNQFIEKGETPIEFYALGIKKEKYTIKDIYNVIGYMAFSFDQAHKTDPLVNEINEKLGAKYIEELGVPGSNTTLIESTNKKNINAEISTLINEISKKIPAPQFSGSNAWVLNGGKTKSGKVIFANDPHIQYSQPSIWYQCHIKTPDYEIYGFNIALMPFPLLGHNKNYAYGMTMFLNDDTDYYIEENNPQNNLEYKTEKGYKQYKITNKTIKIKGSEDISYQIKESRHGVLMNDFFKDFKDTRPVAMSWIYTKLPNKTLEATYEISHSNSMENFKNAAEKVHAPGLNLMYGDAKNNIAWFSSAKLYTYRDSLNRSTYLNGSSGNDEIKEFLEFDDNPRAVNPKWNYVYSANNQPDSVNGKLYPGYYSPQDRANRIKQIIEPKSDFTSEDVQKMSIDVTSSEVSQIIKQMSEAIDMDKLSTEDKKALSELKKWNGVYLKQNISPTIYNRFLYEFAKETFKDELGEKGFNQFMNGLYLQKRMSAIQIAKKESVWWDNITTATIKENKKDIVTKAFKNTVGFLKNQLGKNMEDWAWSKVFSVEHEHALGKGGELLRKIFNVGPFSTDGGNGVINNKIHKIDSTGYYKVTSGASTRRIVDFSDINNSVAILPTGQSGNIFSKYYKNQATKYENGEFVKMILSPSEYKKSENHLSISPTNKAE